MPADSRTGAVCHCTCACGWFARWLHPVGVVAAAVGRGSDACGAKMGQIRRLVYLPCRGVLCRLRELCRRVENSQTERGRATMKLPLIQPPSHSPPHDLASRSDWAGPSKASPAGAACLRDIGFQERPRWWRHGTPEVPCPPPSVPRNPWNGMSWRHNSQRRTRRLTHPI